MAGVNLTIDEALFLIDKIVPDAAAQADKDPQQAPKNDCVVVTPAGEGVPLSTCWGGRLSGSRIACAPMPADADKGRRHFQDRLCSRCRAQGVSIPMSRVKIPCDRGLFTNKTTEGLWNNGYGDLPGFRVVNQMQRCTSPRLVIFESEPEAQAASEYRLRPIAPHLDEIVVESEGQKIRLHPCQGTLVPRVSAKRLRPATELDVTSGASSHSSQQSQSKRTLDDWRMSSLPHSPSVSDEADGGRSGKYAHLGAYDGCGSGDLEALSRPSAVSMAVKSEGELLPQTLLPLAVGLDGVASAQRGAHPGGGPLPGLASQLTAHSLSATMATCLGASLRGQPPTASVPTGGRATDFNFEQRYLALHTEMASLLAAHLEQRARAIDTLHPEERAELFEQLQRSLATIQQANLGMLHTWRSGLTAETVTQLQEQGGELRIIAHDGALRVVVTHSDSGADPANAAAAADVADVEREIEGTSRLEELSFPCALQRILSSPSPPKEIGDMTDLGDLSEVSSESAVVGMLPDVNKNVRQLLLLQSKWTNQFDGSPLAQHVERAYSSYVTRTQLPKLVRRLVGFAFLLPAISLAHAPRVFKDKKDVALVLFSTGVPSLVLLAAAFYCSGKAFRKKQRSWRWLVIGAIIAADSCNFWADLFLDFHDFTPRDKDFHIMWELSRFLVMLSACTMAAICGLDFQHTVVLFFAHLMTYVAATVTLYVMWWQTSSQGKWTWRIHLTAIEDRSAGVEELNRTCEWLEDHWLGREGVGASHSSVIIDCLALGLIASVTTVATLYRLNRSERISFVNSFALQSKVNDQSQLLTGKCVELLALFANPSSLKHLPPELGNTWGHMRPLSLGRELKSLLRSVPAPYVFIEPSATLEDVRTAVQQHNPQIALFSGHSIVGSLAFELPNGTVDLPSASDFISALRPSEGAVSKLRCVVLNGCNTLTLAMSMIEHRPSLQLVCWRSLAEDAAARAFAKGFYSAVGSDLGARIDVDIEEAYNTGLDTFEVEGFKYGDPSEYLHAWDHPHIKAPQFHTCLGCMPPVHGQPVLLRFRHGEVQVRAGTAGWLSAEQFRYCESSNRYCEPIRNAVDGASMAAV